MSTGSTDIVRLLDEFKLQCAVTVAELTACLDHDKHLPAALLSLPDPSKLLAARHSALHGALVAAVERLNHLLNSGDNATRSNIRLAGEEDIASTAATTQPTPRRAKIDSDCVLEFSDEEDDGKDDVLGGLSLPPSREELRSQVLDILAARDRLWLERLALKEKQAARPTEKQEETLRETARALQEKELVIAQLQAAVNEKNGEVAELQGRVSQLSEKEESLAKDVEAGRRIIRQFSELMIEKASNICHYCRRSGTLPPPPN